MKTKRGNLVVSCFLGCGKIIDLEFWTKDPQPTVREGEGFHRTMPISRTEVWHLGTYAE